MRTKRLLTGGENLRPILERFLSNRELIYTIRFFCYRSCDAETQLNCCFVTENLIVLNIPVKTSDRNGAIELLRYVCSVGIVWFHLGGPYAWAGHAALLVFIILSVNFSMAQRETTWGRTRVLKLWIFWSAIYAFLKVTQSLALGQQISSEFHWWMLVTGPALPLWFLPFIYVANGAATYYNKIIAGHRNWLEALLLPSMTLGCIALIPMSPGVPFSQWLLGASGVFMAISLFRAREEPRYLIVMAAFLACALLAGAGHEIRMLMLALFVASIAIFRAPVWRSEIANQLGAISLGVYVLHHGVSVALKGVIFGYPTTIQIGLIVLLSTMLAMAMKRLPIFGKFI